MYSTSDIHSITCDMIYPEDIYPEILQAAIFKSKMAKPTSRIHCYCKLTL